MGSIIFLVFVIAFIFVLFRLFSASEGRSGPFSGVREWSRPKPDVRLSVAARNAMRQAGYQGGEAYVNVVDVGLLAYRGSSEPKLVRYGDVAMDTDYLRPFVELWLPHQARGPVRFELVDQEGRLRYADESRYDLVRGVNTLLPGTWLPLRGKTVSPDRWSLRVLAGDTLLAAHGFGWRAVGGGQIQRYMASDGEISPSLQQALRAQPREAVSLEDLLGDEEEQAKRNMSLTRS
jgi:hypothetical protein